MPVGVPATAFKWGHAVEVQSDAEGLKGVLGAGEVLKVDDDAASVTVSWHAAETEADRGGAGSTRSAAPPVPAGWAAYLRPGEEVDLFHDGAWWAVFLESRKGGRAKVVEGPDDPLPRDVKVSQLRPRFSWLGWSGGWKYSADGRDVHLPPGPAPLSHNFPNEAAAGGQSSKGRAVRKPKKHGAGADGGRAGASLVPLVDPERVPKLGEYLEVEVEEPEEEGGGVAWKTALVTSILERQRFVAMVNGDDDFMEEYGMEDEGKEWRKVPPDDLARVRAENEAAKVRYQEKVEEQEEGGAIAAGGGRRRRRRRRWRRRRRRGRRRQEGQEAQERRGEAKARFGFGMEVEVKGHDKGFEGSWYAAEVLSTKEKGGCCLVQYDALYPPPPAGEAVGLATAKEELRADQRPEAAREPRRLGGAADAGDAARAAPRGRLVAGELRRAGEPHRSCAPAAGGTRHLVQLSDLRRDGGGRPFRMSGPSGAPSALPTAARAAARPAAAAAVRADAASTSRWAGAGGVGRGGGPGVDSSTYAAQSLGAQGLMLRRPCRGQQSNGVRGCRIAAFAFAFGVGRRVKERVSRRKATTQTRRTADLCACVLCGVWWGGMGPRQ